MKIRMGFISNSSSSSFVCAVCGGIESGMDVTLSDVGMTSCEVCGHSFHTDCINGQIFDPDYDGYDTVEEYLEDNGYESIDESDYIKCPVCNFKILAVDDVDQYLRKIHGGAKVITEEIKANFSTYDEFKNFLKSKGN